MEVQKRKQGDVIILECSGRLTIGVGDVALREAVHEALDDGHRKLLLVLDDISAIDSAGIGEMVAAHTSAKNRGGEVKLAKLSRKVSGVLQTTQLVGVLSICGSVEEALAEFAGLP